MLYWSELCWRGKNRKAECFESVEGLSDSGSEVGWTVRLLVYCSHFVWPETAGVAGTQLGKRNRRKKRSFSFIFVLLLGAPTEARGACEGVNMNWDSQYRRARCPRHANTRTRAVHRAQPKVRKKLQEAESIIYRCERQRCDRPTRAARTPKRAWHDIFITEGYVIPCTSRHSLKWMNPLGQRLVDVSLTRPQYLPM